MLKRMAVLFAVLALFLPGWAFAATNNILFILADDLGVEIAPFYRNPPRIPQASGPPMPNMTALANSGIRFSNAWATPWCSPTRASVMTGQYGFRHGLGVPIDQNTPAFSVEIPYSAVTIPEVVATSSRNYYLQFVGKWHLNEGDLDAPNRAGWPNAVGPHPGAGGPASSGTGSPDYFNWRKYRNGSNLGLTTTYATTDQVNEAIAAIDAANTAGRPYFIWLAFNAPHSPFHSPPAALHTRSLGGSPTDRQMYEAAVEAMDTEIGRLLNNVDLSTTTVIFMGDNGTPTNIAASPYLGTHAKGTIFDGGMRVPLVIAGLGVTGRGYVDGLVNCVDLFPTFMNLAGITSSSLLASVDIDGISLVPYFTNPERKSLRPFIYGEEFVNTWNNAWERATMNGRYAFIERQTGTTRAFYDMLADPLQATNLLSRTLTRAETLNLNALEAQMDALLATR